LLHEGKLRKNANLLHKVFQVQVFFFLTAFVMQIITIGTVHVIVFGEKGGKMRTDKSWNYRGRHDTR